MNAHNIVSRPEKSIEDIKEFNLNPHEKVILFAAKRLERLDDALECYRHSRSKARRAMDAINGDRKLRYSIQSDVRAAISSSKALVLTPRNCGTEIEEVPADYVMECAGIEQRARAYLSSKGYTL